MGTSAGKFRSVYPPSSYSGKVKQEVVAKTIAELPKHRSLQSAADAIYQARMAAGKPAPKPNTIANWLVWTPEYASVKEEWKKKK